MPLRNALATRGMRAGLILGLLSVYALMAFLVSGPVGAQQTPVESQQSVGGTPAPLIRIEVATPDKPIPAGEEFEARVLVENVDHLAAFELTIGYDQKRLSYEGVRDQGQFLAASQRGENISCSEPDPGPNSVVIVCTTLGPPLCLGGTPGASGSGLLATGVFKSKGGGSTVLDLRETVLISDDVQPCDPVELNTQSIEHGVGNASVELEGGGGGVSWLGVGPIIAIVALVLIGGSFAGFLWYRRRGTSA